MFLGVVFVIFMLFIVAYFIRMELDDWSPMPESNLLWLNTLLLFICSVIMQLTRGAAQKGVAQSVKYGMVAAGVFTLAFVYGQVSAWEEMNNAGYYLASNPANSFFMYLQDFMDYISLAACGYGPGRLLKFCLGLKLRQSN